MSREERMSESVTMSQRSQRDQVSAETFRRWSGWCVTSLIVVGPLIAILLVIIGLWGRQVGIADLALLVGLYVVSCLGVTAGYHRLFTHKSFVAGRAMKIALAVAGAVAVEGSLMSWVSNHRRHHRHSDHAGDPHSPFSVGDDGDESGNAPRRTSLGGLFHAHVGWLFRAEPADEQRFASDLLEDRDLRIVTRLFPLWALCGLAIPFLAGWVFAGTLTGAVTALVWGGLVRNLPRAPRHLERQLGLSRFWTSSVSNPRPIQELRSAGSLVVR
jgi:stearoyl-CoA desaturase (Delta-9 desaturase)